VITPDLAEQILLTAGAGMLGASIGSFVNVCIYRWPRGLSVAAPKRSFCPQCKEPIRALDNIPVLSWLLLGGRCRKGRCAIPVSYFLIELFSGLGAALAFAKYGWIAAICFMISEVAAVRFAGLAVSKGSSPQRRSGHEESE
jgi:prepilin signal peptidase PulO-like enzyme (type II secretory pathway)